MASDLNIYAVNTKDLGRRGQPYAFRLFRACPATNRSADAWNAFVTRYELTTDSGF